MATVDKIKHRLNWHDYRTDLPQWLVGGIGQVAVEWTVLERELEELIRTLMDVEIHYGRIIVNWMNAKTRGITATNLIQSHVLYDKLPPRELNAMLALVGRVTALQTKRDRYAHGLFAKTTGKWQVLLVRQSRVIPELKDDLKKLARAVLPQPEPVTKTIIIETAADIAQLAHDVQAFCERARGLLPPSQSTTPEYTRRRRGYRHKPKK